MRTLLLIACLATSASAQVSPDPMPSRPSTGERILLVAGAVGGGLLVGVTLPPAAPLGIAAGTYGTSAALGLDPSVGGVLFETFVGVTVGLGVGALSLYLVTEVGGADGDLSTSLGTAALGLLVGSATTGVLHGLRVVPMTAPTGERGAGVSLHLGL